MSSIANLLAAMSGDTSGYTGGQSAGTNIPTPDAIPAPPQSNSAPAQSAAPAQFQSSTDPYTAALMAGPNSQQYQPASSGQPPAPASGGADTQSGGQPQSGGGVKGWLSNFLYQMGENAKPQLGIPTDREIADSKQRLALATQTTQLHQQEFNMRIQQAASERAYSTPVPLTPEQAQFIGAQPGTLMAPKMYDALAGKMYESQMRPERGTTNIDAATYDYLVKGDPSRGIAPLSPPDALAKIKQMAQDAKPDTAAQDKQRAVGIRTRMTLKQPVSADERAWLQAHEYESTLGPRTTFNLNNAPATTPGPVATTPDGQPLNTEQKYAKLGNLAPQVRAIVEGRQSMPTGRALTTPYGKQLSAAVNDIDPGWSEQRAQQRKAFITGPDGRNIGALNTATVHLSQFSDAVDAMNNGSWRAGNAVYNAVARQFGAATASNPQLVMHALAGELANALKGQATDPEIKSMLVSLSMNQSPEQAAGTIKNGLHVLAAKLNTYDERYHQINPADTSYSPVLPAARAVYSKYGVQTGAPADTSFDPARDLHPIR